MSHLRSVLACFVLLVSICQANTGGLRASTSSQGSSLLTNALVGLAAVVGFLFIVFFILIIKRIFFEKATDDEESDPEACAVYENQAMEQEEETPHTDEAKTTNL
ncbi:hypothetical protein KOW79_004570 [Hemibagrus wyckioides]|uniref:Small integral membrane protein 24 n=1 Tax=Hemibagrus wyckioides TaxID=337641 RepID=A0A9D3SPT3_9TELE|nr:small integral membrane protein 24 [Hemibagrus wyckioides]KAG7332736.1 hypothetical protein KOW79_004570 [Hemibagrus wyckioides]